MDFLDGSNSVIQKQSFYHRILPPRLRNYFVNSTVNDIGVENMFYVQLEMDSSYPRAFNDATLYSRIFIEFPTVDSLGNALFASDLGGYQKTGDIVGCAFDTWTTYYVDPVSGYSMQCRLIKSEVPGAPVRVEVLHHGAFSSSWRFMRFWIAKVFNPTRGVTSVPISVKIEHVEVSTNNIYELYYDTFDVFMNSQPVGTLTNNVQDCQTYATTIFSSGPINHAGLFRFDPRSVSGYNSLYGYYFVLDTTSDFKPVNVGSYSSTNCNTSYFNLCLAFPDINYFVIWSKSDSYWARLDVVFGEAISQRQTTMVAKVWSSWRYMGTRTINISPTCWNQIVSTPTNFNIAATSSNYAYFQSRRKLEVQVQFQLQEPLPSDGSIEIKFNSNVPMVYPHCRSVTGMGSALNAQGSTNNGEIGCLVQNNYSWVITGFNAMTVNDWVIVVGFIDLPSSNGYIGGGEIITYNNTHPSDIHYNGFIIDYYYHSNFMINVSNANSLNVDHEITMDETLPLRAGYKGPLRFKFQLSSALNGPNAGKITVRIPEKSTMAVAGGFSLNYTSKHVCQIVDMLSYIETGCVITSTVEENGTNPNILFTMITSSTLTANTLYKMIINTHDGTQPEGLNYPTVAGTYKVDFNFDTTGSTNMAIHNQLYMEVYGTKFTYLTVFPFCTVPLGKNLIWIELTPTTTITTTHQIVIEIPTKSSAGATLFANDLGLGLTDASDIPIDILAAPFASGFMRCRLFLGDRANYKPARIVCGSLAGTITSAQKIWFSIVVYNPSLPAGEVKLSVPFFIYTVEQGTTYKTNFDVV
jgi:hypothetical protein